jgi:DNA-binding NtrC family response regulator
VSRGKILVVDDEGIVRTSCSRALSPEGYEVKLSQNGADAMRMLEEESFDLVLTDLKMPDIDGIEVLKMIKERWPQTEVIVITGYQTVDTAVKSIKLGAFDYIEKPFTPDSLIAAVNNAITNKKK